MSGPVGVAGLPPQIDQLELFKTRAEGIEKAFWEFHNKYPQVAGRLYDLAREAKDRGHRRIGIKMLYEVLRWDILLGRVRDTTGLKLNNNYASRYARWMMINLNCSNPDCDGCDITYCMRGLFETRELDEPTTATARDPRADA